MSTITPEAISKSSAPQDDPTSLLPKRLARSRPLFDREIVNRAIRASPGKLNPVTLMKNPVMFVVEVGATLTTLFLIRDIFTGAGGIGFSIQISLWLWFTVLFANFACAFPRASAMASAKLANRTVNQSQSEIWMENPIPPAPVNMSRIRSAVVSVAPTSTTNMTGFFINVTGFSFPGEARIARFTISRSNSGRERASLLGSNDVGSSCGALDFEIASGVMVDIGLTPKRQQD